MSAMIREEHKMKDGETGIPESSLNPISMWVESMECGFVTAWRTRYENITDGAFKPVHQADGYDRKVGKRSWKRGDTFKEGDTFTVFEKRFYNKELNAALLQLGYGVTKVRGVFGEEGCTGCDTGREESFFVVNLHQDPDFKRRLFRLSEYYNQDCFMYSPLGSDEGVDIGTNAAEWPGYGNEVRTGSFRRPVQARNMSGTGNVEPYKGLDTIYNYNMGARQCMRQCCEHVLVFLKEADSSRQIP